MRNDRHLAGGRFPWFGPAAGDLDLEADAQEGGHGDTSTGVRCLEGSADTQAPAPLYLLACVATGTHVMPPIATLGISVMSAALHNMHFWLSFRQPVSHES